MPRKRQRRRVCFVTGTRAEFGLMESTLRAIRDHSRLELQIIATGVHTHASRGRTVDDIRRDGWKLDRVIEWADDSSSAAIARETGRVTAALVDAFADIDPQIVLVVGDRVEAFAAATAAHLGGRAVAHVHGGDRALGQVDDALRHAITKLAHLHFPATEQSSERIYKLGEERSRIHVVGAPGIDGIRSAAASRTALKRAGLDFGEKSFRLLLLHPTDADVAAERRRTRLLLSQLAKHAEGPIVALLPNNDPGAKGIADTLFEAEAANEVHLLTHASRPLFLGLLRDCRLLAGNSSAGIIEAGSFATPVVDIGPRQQGRERGGNVFHADWKGLSIGRAIQRASAYAGDRVADNPYDLGGAARRICRVLAVPLGPTTLRKLIRY